MLEFQIEDQQSFASIKVIGCGGAGNNAINRMVDAGLKGVKVVSGDPPDAFYDVTTVTVTGTVTGVNTTQVYGVPDGVRICTVTYRYGGKVINITWKATSTKLTLTDVLGNELQLATGNTYIGYLDDSYAQQGKFWN